jgi:hypothetical protein
LSEFLSLDEGLKRSIEFYKEVYTNDRAWNEERTRNISRF